jgi:ribosomal protein S18 acetylase RimI-like enzyme
MSRVIVTPARKEDRSEWLLLWRHYQVALPDTVDDCTWARILDPGEPVGCFIARRPAGSAVGFANYVLFPSTWSERCVCHLQDLFVLPSARRQGAGSQLVDALVARGRQDGWCRIDIVTSHDNDGGRRFYERIARRKDGVRYEIALPGERPDLR